MALQDIYGGERRIAPAQSGEDKHVQGQPVGVAAMTTQTLRRAGHAGATHDMSDTMQAVVVHGPADYRLEQVPVPTPEPGELLVQVGAVGICASDLKCYHDAPKYWGDGIRPATTPQRDPRARISRYHRAHRRPKPPTMGRRHRRPGGVRQIVPCWNCRFSPLRPATVFLPWAAFTVERASIIRAVVKLGVDRVVERVGQHGGSAMAGGPGRGAGDAHRAWHA